MISGATAFPRSIASRSSAHSKRILLGDRRDDAVQTQIDNELAVMIRDVPDGGNRDAETCVGCGITALDTVKRVLCSNCGKDAVSIIE